MQDGDRRTDQDSRERIAVLETQMKSMLKQHEGMARDIRTILETLSEAKGGWRFLLLIAGAGGAVGTFLTKWGAAMAASITK